MLKKNQVSHNYVLHILDTIKRYNKNKSSKLTEEDILVLAANSKAGKQFLETIIRSPDPATIELVPIFFSLLKAFDVKDLQKSEKEKPTELTNIEYLIRLTEDLKVNIERLEPDEHDRLFSLIFEPLNGSLLSEFTYKFTVRDKIFSLIFEPIQEFKYIMDRLTIEDRNKIISRILDPLEKVEINMMRIHRRQMLLFYRLPTNDDFNNYIDIIIEASKKLEDIVSTYTTYKDIEYMRKDMQHMREDYGKRR